METKITIHKCFQCHYCNKFYNVPYYVKGKKCKRCHKYNYFNAQTKHIRKIINHNNNNGINAQSNLHQSQQSINLRFNNVVREFNDLTQSILRNIQNNLDLQNEIINNLVIPSPLQQRNRIENNNNQDNHHIDIPSTNFSVEPNNFSYYFNTNRNNNNQNFYMNFSSNNNLGKSNNINNNIIKYSWLKKEKCTIEIINKYGSDNICPICLEAFKINVDIHISKCNHLFHYKCIETSITKNSTDCPICRSNLKDGSKKQIINNNRIYVNYNLNSIHNNANANNNNFDFNNRNNSNRYSSISSDNNRNNHNFSFCLII